MNTAVRSKRTCVAASLLVLVACDVGRDDAFSVKRPVRTPRQSNSFVIGLVGSMSGSDAWRGDDAFEGADLAVHTINRGLGGGAVPYELVTLDDAGDARRATRLVRELAASERTIGIVYAGPPEALRPAAGALRTAQIPAFLCFGDLYTARLLTSNLFQSSPPYLWQARRLAAYLVRDRGYRRIAVLARAGLSGTTAVDALRTELRRLGRDLTVAARYGNGAADLMSRLRTLRRRRVQAIVAEGAPSGFETIVRALARMDASYETTAAARAIARRAATAWRPHLAGFDLAMSPLATTAPPSGTVVADSYVRGVHYLPVPAFESFRRAYRDWWGETPLGWEHRAFEAARAIAWANALSQEKEISVIDALERLRGARFGGGHIVLGPDDHTTVNQIDVGLWVVPRPGIPVRERGRFRLLPWVPLARGFSVDGDETDITAEDWRYLFKGAPPAKGPPPRLGRALFGVTTPRRDPVH